MVFQSISELSTTSLRLMEVEHKRVRSSNFHIQLSCAMKTLSIELSLGPKNQHVVSLSRRNMRPIRDVGDRHADMYVLVSRASATDRVKVSNSHLYSIS